MASITGRLMTLGLKAARAYWRVVKPVTVGVQAIIRDGDGGVLLVRHRYGSDSHRLPGGRAKRGETLVEALRREVAEETGVHIHGGATAVSLLGVYTNREEGKTDHVAVFVVPASAWSGAPTPDGFEVSEAAFADLDEPPKRTSPGTVRRLEEHRGEREISFQW